MAPPRRTPIPSEPRRTRPRRGPRALLYGTLSLAVHLALLLLIHWRWGDLHGLDLKPQPRRPVQLLIEVPPPPPPEEPTPPTPPPLNGQIVETPPPLEERRPEKADYLAEHDQTVPEETRTEKFRVNPEVLAPVYSREDKLEFEELLDLDVDEPSTGAQVGNDRFDPDRDGALASLPSPFALTNKDGLQKPVPSAHRSQALAGAPQNDRLDEKIGDRLALNTIEIKYADYLNRIRRLVNFYWEQNLDNRPASTPLVKPSYTTVVDVVLDGNGALESIEVRDSSGSAFLDKAVVDAFRIAGPFPNPPSALIAADGRVYLPDFGFTVEVGQARATYMGVDPRQGVRYPGILKSPR